MHAPEIEIVNRALGQVHQGPLVSLDQPGKVAQDCRMYLPACRRALLRRYIWKEARQSVLLTHTLDITPAPGWNFSHRVPTDFILHVRIDTEQPYSTGYLDNQIEHAYTNGALMTHVTPINLDYIRDITTHDPLFETALEFELAARLSLSLGNDKENVQRMVTLAGEAIREAKRAGSIELQTQAMHMEGLTLARAGHDRLSYRKGPVA